MSYLRGLQIGREHIKCDLMQATDKRIAKKSKLSIVHSTNAAVCRAHRSQPDDCLVVGQVSQRLGTRLTLPAMFALAYLFSCAFSNSICDPRGPFVECHSLLNHSLSRQPCQTTLTARASHSWDSVAATLVGAIRQSMPAAVGGRID